MKLDAADVLEEARLIRRGLQTAQASVRRTALDGLSELDGVAAAAFGVLNERRTAPRATLRKT